MATKDDDDDAHKTALVMRTKAPLHPLVLDRIYEFALLVKDSDYYDFWILVDETKNNQTEQLLDLYFHTRGGAPNLQPPRVFSVSETILLQHFPRLTSYIHNKPERNSHNASGVCCRKPIMWQMFVPTFAIFLHEHTNYSFAWSFEDDISTHGHTVRLDEGAFPLRRQIMMILLRSGYDILRVEHKTRTLSEIYAEAVR